MAIVHTLCLTERYQDCSKLTITDTSEYLEDAPDRRQDAARVLFGAKMDENQVLVYIDSILNPDPLTALSWTFDSSGLGAYRFFYIDVPLYDSGDTYVNETTNVAGAITRYPNIIYHEDSDSYYLAIGSSFSNIEPTVTSGWEDSWEVLPIESLKSHYNNDKITVYITDDISTCEYEACVLEAIDEKTDKELVGLCPNSPEFFNVIKMQFLLDAAISANWQQKATRSEVILVNAKKKYCCA